MFREPFIDSQGDEVHIIVQTLSRWFVCEGPFRVAPEQKQVLEGGGKDMPDASVG